MKIWYEGEYQHVYKFVDHFDLNEYDKSVRADAMALGKSLHKRPIGALFSHQCNSPSRILLFALVPAPILDFFGVKKVDYLGVSLELFAQIAIPKNMPQNGEDEKSVWDKITWSARQVHSVNLPRSYNFDLDPVRRSLSLHSSILAFALWKEAREVVSHVDFPYARDW
jgi:hypothetical protein